MTINRYNPVRNHWWISARRSGKLIHHVQTLTWSVWTPTGRNDYKQTTSREACKSLILPLWDNKVSMKACLNTSYIFHKGRQLWCEIFRERTCDTSIQGITKVLQNCHWMGRQYIFWINLVVGLHQPDHGNINVIFQAKELTQVITPHPPKPIICTVQSISKTIRDIIKLQIPG